jgi:hypothetical protein
MKTPFAIRKIEHWSYDYIKMDCDSDEGKCYGVLAVRPIHFAVDLMLTYLNSGSSYLFRLISIPCDSEFVSHWRQRV